jgi:hypothetical protein
VGVPRLVVAPDRILETLGRVLSHAERICSLAGRDKGTG